MYKRDINKINDCGNINVVGNFRTDAQKYYYMEKIL